MSPKHPLDHVTVSTVWFKAIPKATVQDTSLVRFVQVLCSDFWISVTLGTTHPKCHPECGCGVQGARQGAPGSRTACAPSWERWDPPKPFSSSLFPFTPSRLLLSRCSRLSTQAQLPTQTIWKRKQQTICKPFPSCASSDPKVTGKGCRGQGAHGNRSVRECPQPAAAAPGTCGPAPWHGLGCPGTHSCFVPNLGWQEPGGHRGASPSLLSILAFSHLRSSL